MNGILWLQTKLPWCWRTENNHKSETLTNFTRLKPAATDYTKGEAVESGRVLKVREQAPKRPSSSN